MRKKSPTFAKDKHAFKQIGIRAGKATLIPLNKYDSLPYGTLPVQRCPFSYGTPSARGAAEFLEVKASTIMVAT